MPNHINDEKQKQSNRLNQSSSASQRKEQPFRMVDNRPEAVYQRQLQESIRNSVLQKGQNYAQPVQRKKSNKSLLPKNNVVQRYDWEDDFEYGVSTSDIPRLIKESSEDGGHTDERHIYIGWYGLMTRKIPEASAFGNEKQAYMIISDMINNNFSEIQEHVDKNPNGKKGFIFRKEYKDVEVLKYDKVLSTSKGKPSGTIGGQVIVVLKYVPPGPDHDAKMVLITAYPIAYSTQNLFGKRGNKNKHAYDKHKKKSFTYNKLAEKDFEDYQDNV